MTEYIMTIDIIKLLIVAFANLYIDFLTNIIKYQDIDDK